MVNIVFPGIPIQREQIVYQFSGVRPLPAADASTPGQISRDHSIKVSEPGDGLPFPIYSLVGGKWTSFRAFSEEVADKTLATLNLTRKKNTRNLAIGGGRDYPGDQLAYEAWIEAAAFKTDITLERVSDLFERYGTRAEDVAGYITKETDAPLTSLPSYSNREIEFIVKTEKVLHIDDFLLRRSMLAKLGQLSFSSIDEIANITSDVLSWSAERRDQEIKRTCQILEEIHGVSLVVSPDKS